MNWNHTCAFLFYWQPLYFQSDIPSWWTTLIFKWKSSQHFSRKYFLVLPRVLYTTSTSFEYCDNWENVCSMYITCNTLDTVISLLSIYARAYLSSLLPYFTQQLSEKVIEPWQQSGFNFWWSLICMEAQLNESTFTSITTFFQVWALQRDNWMTKQYFDWREEKKPEKEAWGFKKLF